MWRKALIYLGEFIDRILTLNTLLVVYGVAGSGIIIVNIVANYSKTPFEIAKDIGITFLWLLLLFVIIYLAIRGAAKFLIWLGNYYPTWYYFPKLIVDAKLSPNKMIEATITNPRKRQNITLRVFYGSIQSKDVSIGVSGVAPESVKELLPLVPIPFQNHLFIIY
jgi:hypothetical protein